MAAMSNSTARSPQRADLLIVNASELVVGSAVPLRGTALGSLNLINGGAVAVVDGRVAAVGPTAEVTDNWTADHTVDVGGRLVTPSFVDSHAHLIHAGSRHAEWEARATGVPKHGIDGGIRWSIARTREASSDAMRIDALALLDIALEHGTTVFETKTGYGLDVDTELRLLQIAVTLDHPIQVIPTYLGAHVVPADYADRRNEFSDLVISMIDRVRSHCGWFDVWCDPIAFTSDETRRMGLAALAAGMKIRLHADQTGSSGAVGLGVELGARSVDHLEHISDADLVRLGQSDTVATILPAVTFHMLEGGPHVGPWCRRIIDSGSIVALATDYNPGTCPTISMQMVMQCAARVYRMSYAESWNAATCNAAASLDLNGVVGCLVPGARADIVVWNAEEHGQVINRFGHNQVDQVFVSGQRRVASGRRVDVPTSPN
jgi:imidazolonepropionase